MNAPHGAALDGAALGGAALGGAGAAVFWALLLIERGVEVIIARRNECRLRARGGIEVHAGTTRLLLAFHGVWFASFIIEACAGGARLRVPVAAMVAAVVLLQALRYWCIASLGRHWNTRVLVLPGARRVTRGPYRRMRHPNYAIVIVELVIYPAVFGLWVTASLGAVVNPLLVALRIRQEEQALAAAAQDVP